MGQFSLFAKRSLKSLAASCGGNRFLNRNRRRPNDVSILAYHRVVADIVRAEYDACYGLVVSAETFERQLRIVQQHYEVVTMDDAAQIIRGEKRCQKPAAVITFDDGYADNYEVAWPILKRLGLPAMIYLPTSMIGQQQPLDHDRVHWLVLLAEARGVKLEEHLQRAGIANAAEITAQADALAIIESLVYLPMSQRRAVIESLEGELGTITYPTGYRLMDWEMVCEMAQSGISFGSHTAHHPVLTYEDEATIETEINQSKQKLKDLLGQATAHFAYPNGYYNELVRGYVAKAGFATAVTTERRVVKAGDDLLTCGRFSLCEESTRGISGKFEAAIARLRLGL
ncbi:MAG: polysaccharide deacetylase family protein [Blastocatellia bacterium]|nr:polysaccharide deacetylase family protein [Blastocatellia bacterium]